MLSPQNYSSDSRQMWKAVGGDGHEVLDHVILSERKRSRGVQLTRQLWTKRFKNEPYDAEELLGGISIVSDGANGKSFRATQSSLSSYISFDVIHAASEQAAFFYQISMSHYRDINFVSGAVERYAKFLMLNQQYRDTRFVPTSDIDIVWRAHVLHPVNYRSYTEKHLGKLLVHEGFQGACAGGGDVAERREDAMRKWKEKFGAKMKRNGAMWRGNVGREERLLTGTIEMIAQDLTDTGSFDITETDPGRVLKTEDCPALAKVEWVYLTEARTRPPPPEQSVTGGEVCIERATSLRKSADTQPILDCRVRHTLIQDHGALEPSGYHTFLDIFKRGEKSQTAYPIATAHDTLPHTIPKKDVLKASNPFTSAEKVLVLRMYGRDWAFLTGEWVGFQAPRQGGFLRLRIMFIESGTWAEVTREAKRAVRSTRPGKYSIALPGQGSLQNRTIAFNLSTGKLDVTCGGHVLPAYLMSMSAAAVFIALQPKYRPRDRRKRSETTMYPAWTVRQGEYAMLRGVGGEVISDGRRHGLGAMLHCAKQNEYVPDAEPSGAIRDGVTNSRQFVTAGERVGIPFAIGRGRGLGGGGFGGFGGGCGGGGCGCGGGCGGGC